MREKIFFCIAGVGIGVLILRESKALSSERKEIPLNTIYLTFLKSSSPVARRNL